MNDDTSRYVALEESLGFIITRAARMVGREADLAARKVDSTYSQLSVLSVMRRNDTTSPREVAIALDVDSGYISRVVDKLEHCGLLERTRSLADRRVVHMRLTDRGGTLAAQAPIVTDEMLNSRLKRFSGAELKELRRLLEKFVGHV
ncbi:MarR family winged helix-turn-helix transcriptional regulator [Paraburkholderia strydomiana]|uniref:MarR family winged helix-turn-helix transcriptional regulator n=1 Tax=Paraburkholderia strydomiana TaxID=1245417 RepID=UPI0038BD1873